MVTTPRRPTAGDASGAQRLSNDRIFGLLSSSRRRTMLRVLDRAADGLTVSELAEGVATEAAAGTDDPGEETERVRISLRHAHLPKCTAAGVVRYDRERNVVRLTSSAEPLLDLLSVVERPGGRTLVSRIVRRVI